MWLIKDVAGLMRGKCAPAGGSYLQPGFVVSPLGQDSLDKHLIVIKCDHLLMSGESFKDYFGVLIFNGGLTDCQISLQHESGRALFPLRVRIGSPYPLRGPQGGRRCAPSAVYPAPHSLSLPLLFPTPEQGAVPYSAAGEPRETPVAFGPC